MQRYGSSKVAEFVRDQNGSALAEAAILVPVLLILFLGVFEFSYLFYQQQLIEIGIRDAARYLSRTSLDNPCDQANFVTNAKKLATTGSVDASTPPRVCTNGTCWDVANVQITCAVSTGTGGPYILPDGTFGPPNPWIITVTTSYLDPSLGLFGLLGLSPPNISFTHSERSIGTEQAR
jgi:Flp pilus assembly protein TadG